ncbi:Rab family, other [Strigomonas culicis]|uniref:Rab family, other n=1 Tax=Strigomonas culicis TaxID=28005 RepID=S9VW23_9TRYP|nr:Rab family, other [Strigomonas culicis]|eukprot:EPY31216.1 Rab family, other [Strigomonas culicis]
MDSGSSCSEEDTHTFKIILLGNGAVGKTSLIRYYCESGFAQNYKQTIGLDFYSKKITLPAANAPEVSLQIWDIGGQQIGGTMLNNYIYGSDAVCLVYDVTNVSTFKDLEDWKAAVEAALAEGASADDKPRKAPLMYLVGNKVDLPNRQVSDSLHDRIAQQYETRTGFIVSARSGEKVNAIFTKIAADLTGTELKKNDLDMADRVTAKVISAPEERVEATRAPVVLTKNKKKKDDCVVM